jgi:hypothetical protein
MCCVVLIWLVIQVYRISDILRGAHSTVIALKASPRQPQLHKPTELLQQWGSRIWTFPEVLLSPGDSLKVYTVSNQTILPSERVLKTSFAVNAWSDAAVSRQLIDHYMGNCNLSRLEMVSLAIKCLYKRDTVEKFKGDRAYALMGLLRLRPNIDESDSDFQAFAR